MLHLGQVDERDLHFKATAWPSFVAGAETRNHSCREWLLGRLFAAWEVCPWGYIFTAVAMLRTMWETQDARNVVQDGSLEEESLQHSEDKVLVGGLRMLWAMETDFLVV